MTITRHKISGDPTVSNRDWELDHEEFIEKYYPDDPPFCPDVIAYLLEFSNNNGGARDNTNKIIEKICTMIERRTKPFKSDPGRCLTVQKTTTEDICALFKYAQNIQKSKQGSK